MKAQTQQEFIIQREKQLFSSFFPYKISEGEKLLHVGLPTVPPEFFAELGFQVSAIAFSHEELKNHQTQNSLVDWHLGKLPPYPFDDYAFDYAVLSHCLTMSNSEEILAEACRLAAKTVFIAEYNSFSLNSLSPKFSPVSLAKLVRENYPNMSFSLHSALYLPLFIARRYPALDKALPLPLGSLMILALKQPDTPLTPVGALTT